MHFRVDKLPQPPYHYITLNQDSLARTTFEYARRTECVDVLLMD
jgi:hypothetical protein